MRTTKTSKTPQHATGATPPRPQSPPIHKPFLTLREASAYAGCSAKTIRRAVYAKALPHYRFGMSESRGKIYLRATDLEAFFNDCRLGAR
jgi:excisionase family DNA binding protein